MTKREKNQLQELDKRLQDWMKDMVNQHGDGPLPSESVQVMVNAVSYVLSVMRAPE
jgi:hypothetical protein